MNTLSDDAMILVIQNLQLAIDYQHRKLKEGGYDEDDASDIEEYLAQADLILGDIRLEFERRRLQNLNLPPVAEIPRIDL